MAQWQRAWFGTMRPEVQILSPRPSIEGKRSLQVMDKHKNNIMRETVCQSHRKQVLVTGGAGFIGSHLTRELLRHGYRVTVLDNLSTGKIENIAGLIDNEDSDSNDTGKISFIQGSITDLSLLQKLFQGMDFIFHQAAIPSMLQ